MTTSNSGTVKGPLLREPYESHSFNELRAECYRRGVRPIKKGPFANSNKAGFMKMLRDYDNGFKPSSDRKVEPCQNLPSVIARSHYRVSAQSSRPGYNEFRDKQKEYESNCESEISDDQTECASLNDPSTDENELDYSQTREVKRQRRVLQFQIDIDRWQEEKRRGLTSELKQIIEMISSIRADLKKMDVKEDRDVIEELEHDITFLVIQKKKAMVKLHQIGLSAEYEENEY